MTKLVSAFNIFYSSNDGFPYTLVFRVKLLNKVDREALRRAVDAAQTRYPYLSVRVIVKDDQYEIAPNAEPIVIRDGVAGTVIGGANVNHHLMALAAQGTTIDFMTYHGYLDGRGTLPYIKTVLYLYLCDVLGRRLNAGKVRLPGEPVLAPEFVEPFPAMVPASIEPFGRYVPEGIYRLPESEASPRDTTTIYDLVIPEDAFMRFTKASDGSPATMISAFLYKAVHQVHPEVTSTVACAMPFDRRGILQVPETFWSSAAFIHLGYGANLAQAPMEKLATISRGMVLVQTQPENVLVGIRSTMAAREKLLGISHEERKAVMAKSMERIVTADTYMVSYVGQLGYGEMNDYIQSINIYLDVFGWSILVEIMAIHNTFVLTFMQDFESPVYVECLKSLLEAEGIRCDVSEPYTISMPKLQLES